MGLALVLAGFLTFMLGTMAAAITGIVHPVLVAMAGFGIITIGGFIISFAEPGALAGAAGARATPVAAVRVMCPNCGAAPSGIDRDGVVVCEYCETRFVVP